MPYTRRNWVMLWGDEIFIEECQHTLHVLVVVGEKAAQMSHLLKIMAVCFIYFFRGGRVQRDMLIRSW